MMTIQEHGGRFRWVRQLRRTNTSMAVSHQSGALYGEWRASRAEAEADHAKLLPLWRKDAEHLYRTEGRPIPSDLL